MQVLPRRRCIKRHDPPKKKSLWNPSTGFISSGFFRCYFRRDVHLWIDPAPFNTVKSGAPISPETEKHAMEKCVACRDGMLFPLPMPALCGWHQITGCAITLRASSTQKGLQPIAYSPVLTSISLRWHYPNQVKGQGTAAYSQPISMSSLFLFLFYSLMGNGAIPKFLFRMLQSQNFLFKIYCRRGRFSGRIPYNTPAASSTVSPGKASCFTPIPCGSRWLHKGWRCRWPRQHCCRPSVLWRRCRGHLPRGPFLLPAPR